MDWEELICRDLHYMKALYPDKNIVIEVSQLMMDYLTLLLTGSNKRLTGKYLFGHEIRVVDDLNIPTYRIIYERYYRDIFKFT